MRKSSHEPTDETANIPWGAIVPVLLLAVVLFLPRMLIGALRHWDEAWYAQVAREMLAESSWLSVRWNGDFWFEKPPLCFWATAAFFEWFGHSEFTARLFSGLCGLGVVGLLAGFVARRTTSAIGILAGLSLLCIPEFCRYATRGQLDVPLTFWIVSSLICFYRGLDRPIWHSLGGISLGLAIMTKGSAAGLGILVQLTYMVAAGDRRPLIQRGWWFSFLVAGAIAAPWHIHQCVVHGEVFWKEYLSRHAAQIVSQIHPDHEDAVASPSFYLEFLLHRQRPIGWVILAAMVLGTGTVWKIRRANQPISSSDRLVTFAWSWTVAMAVGLSLCRVKWSWYLVPMYPGAALLVALLWHRYCGMRNAECGLRKESNRRHLSVHSAFRIPHSAILGVALAMTLITGSEILWGPANKEYEDHIREIGPLVGEHVPSHVALHVLQLQSADRSIFPIAVPYYCNRRVAVAHGLDDLTQIAHNADSVFCVLVHDSQVEAVRAAGKARSEAGWFDMQVLERSGPVTLVRISPRRTESQSNQTFQ